MVSVTESSGNHRLKDPISYSLGVTVVFYLPKQEDTEAR